LVYSLKNSELLKIYSNFYKIRNVEFTISKKYKEGKMRCPTHLSIGQELVPAVFSLICKTSDYAISTHRGHAHYLAKGGSLKKMIAEIYGKETGTSKGKGGSMHLIDLKVNFMGTSAIVGNSIPIGVGLGLSIKLKNKKNFSFVFLGDGAIEEGIFYESLNFSIVKKLPVIYICENNLYSVYSSLKDRQPINRKIYKLAESIGVRSEVCDGNDPLAIYKKFKYATDYVKKNNEPFFLEFKNYRWLEHCGPNFDNNIGYRSAKEFEKWKKKDKLLSIRSKLVNKLSSKKIEKIEKNIDNEIDKAFIFAEKSKFPSDKNLQNEVYAK
jgi:TPP-dependent pyruvate/acetoin dehydrogenase alpha subunit